MAQWRQGPKVRLKTFDRLLSEDWTMHKMSAPVGNDAVNTPLTT